MGDILELSQRYRDEGVDELVFYDITASSDGRVVNKSWINKVARLIDIPFCVAGGIRSLEDARQILNAGADKISVNSPALERPEFISELAENFGVQCIVVGIDSREEDGGYVAYQYTGDETKTVKSKRNTLDWAKEAQERGAGEIVLNCMDNDGVREGYHLKHLKAVRKAITIPLIASGGAGEEEHFSEVFAQTNVDGALAASVFHSSQIPITDLKQYLAQQNVRVRL
jgi:cyclase